MASEAAAGRRNAGGESRVASRADPRRPRLEVQLAIGAGDAKNQKWNPDIHRPTEQQEDKVPYFPRASAVSVEISRSFLRLSLALPPPLAF